jgi:ubiquinone biosynthesis protein
VQRPRVRDQVEVDLDIVLTQARVANTQADPDSRYDVVQIAEEFSRALRDELDYLAEARNCERLGELFADDDTVRFPKVYWDWTTSRVLTLELIEGVPFNRLDELERAGIDRSRMARNGIFCYLRQIFDFGFYHADPHPGNLFAMPDGRIGFTDFGRVGTVSQVGRDQLSDLLVAIVDNDTNLAVDMLVEAAGSPGDIDVALLQRDVSHLLANYSNRPLHEIRMRDLVRQIFELVRDHHLVMSSELALLFATLAVLEGLGTQLDPGFDFVESVAPFARKIATQRNEPAALLRTLVLALRRGGKVMTELPESLLRVMKRAGQGEFRMTVRPTGIEPLLARFERSVNRISFALVVSAILVALGLLLKDTEKPEWFLWVARALLAGGFVVGSWFFISIFIANFRRR